MTSSYTIGHLQADGRRYVKETHTDGFGDIVEIEYGPVAALDYNAVMLARAGALDAEKINGEINKNIANVMTSGSLASTVFKYSAKADNIGPLREAYRSATREACIMIADYLATLTDAQLRSIFGKTQAEVTVLRTEKLTPAIALANNIRAAGGE